MAFTSETPWSVVPATLVGDESLTSIAFGDGIFIAVSVSAEFQTVNIHRSFDFGESWSVDSQIEDPDLSNQGSCRIEYGAGVWVIFGYNGRFARSTDNGATWTLNTVSGYSGLLAGDVKFGNSIFIVINSPSFSPSNLVAVSSDAGETWSAEEITGISYTAGIAFDSSNNEFVVSSDESLEYLTAISSDGVTWSVNNTGLTPYLSGDIEYGDGYFVAETFNDSSGVSEFSRSNDALNWTVEHATSQGNIYTIANGASAWYLATSQSFVGTPDAFFSSDGQNFTQLSSPAWPDGTLIADFAFGENTFAGIKDGAEFIVASDGAPPPEILPTVDPMVMLDVSGNTRTWDMTQNWRSMGKQGEYSKRVIWRRLGQHRSFTARIAISAPVKRAVIACYADIEPGNS